MTPCWSRSLIKEIQIYLPLGIALCTWSGVNGRDFIGLEKEAQGSS